MFTERTRENTQVLRNTFLSSSTSKKLEQTSRMFSNSEVGEPILSDYGTGGGGVFSFPTPSAPKTVSQISNIPMSSSSISATTKRIKKRKQQTTSPEKGQIELLKAELNETDALRQSIEQPARRSPKKGLQSSPSSRKNDSGNGMYGSPAQGSPQRTIHPSLALPSLSPDRITSRSPSANVSSPLHVSNVSAKIMQRVLQETRSATNIPMVGLILFYLECCL